MRRRPKARRAEFNYRRFAKLSLLIFLGVLIYQSTPYIACVYRIADAYELNSMLGPGPATDSNPIDEYRVDRARYSEQAGRSGSYLAAVQFGIPVCWTERPLGFGQHPNWRYPLYGSLGSVICLLLYGRYHTPRWRKDLSRNQREVEESMDQRRRYPKPRMTSDDSDEPPNRL